MRQSRRAFIAGVAALGSGCTGLGDDPTPTPHPDSDGDGVPDHQDDYPNDPRRAFRSFRMEGTPTLDPGEFSAAALTNSPQASGDILHYDVTVEGDTPVDCLVFERATYHAYEDGARDVNIVSEYSRTDVTDTTVTTALDQGEYIFALDYTDLVTEPGPASVTVSRVLELADPTDADES